MSAASESLDTLRAAIEELRMQAAAFVSPAKAQDLMRKWIDEKRLELPDTDRTIAMMADAAILSVDLLLVQPSGSGATAVDRLARTLKTPTAEQSRALAALRAGRYRMLALEEGPDPGTPDPDTIVLRDQVSGERLPMPGMALPPLPPDARLFGLVVPLGDGLFCVPGAMTPLDPAAAAVARAHAGAGMPGTAGCRWADAVYCRVVRHGTLDVPGLNRPREDFDDEDLGWDPDDDDPDVQALLALAMEWEALEGATPSPDLLLRTRQDARVPVILHALAAVATLREAKHPGMLTSFERVLELQLDTVFRRQDIGFRGAALSDIEAALAEADADPELLQAVRAVFDEVRRRVTRGEPRENPELFRLIQKIQALRAKTVAQGCTEEEALAAAQKVAELLDRHGLSITELELRAQRCHGVAVVTDRRRVAGVDTCVPAIAAFFDCRTWSEQPDGQALRHIFFGLRQDIEAAHYLYDLVERAFETETDNFRRGATYSRMDGARRSATTSFQAGLARGIIRKLEDLRAARDGRRSGTVGRDLMVTKTSVVDEEVAKLGLKLKMRGSGGRSRVLSEAFHEGQAAGSRFEFMPAIAGAA
jgi:hypothetical protein